MTKLTDQVIDLSRSIIFHEDKLFELKAMMQNLLNEGLTIIPMPKIPHLTKIVKIVARTDSDVHLDKAPKKKRVAWNKGLKKKNYPKTSSRRATEQTQRLEAKVYMFLKDRAGKLTHLMDIVNGTGITKSTTSNILARLVTRPKLYIKKVLRRHNGKIGDYIYSPPSSYKMRIKAGKSVEVTPVNGKKKNGKSWVPMEYSLANRILYYINNNPVSIFTSPQIMKNMKNQYIHGEDNVRETTYNKVHYELGKLAEHGLIERRRLSNNNYEYNSIHTANNGDTPKEITL